MLNICESCGQHSSQTVYELNTQFELCPRCHYDLLIQLAIRHEKAFHDPQPSPLAA